MTGSPGDLFAELQEITAQLEVLPVGDPQRLGLEQRREELRAAARSLLLSHDPAALRAELQHLERRKAALETEKVQIPKWQQHTGGKLTDPEAAGSRINERLDEANAHDVVSIERRIDEIEEALSRDGQ